MNETTGVFTIKDVSHVLDLLVRHLYGSDPHLTIRELVQNAHDALVELPPGVPDRDKKIVIEVNVFTPPYYVQISDTGVGMTRDEMQDNLGKIGDSEKLQRAVEHPEIIGRFGIGFLSSFIVADKVQVVTKKFGGGTATEWETLDKQKWVIRDCPAHDLAHGTRVRLYLKEVYSADYAERMNDLKSTDGVERILQTYCYLIPYPVQVCRPEESPRRVNAIDLPWVSEPAAATAYKVLFSRNEPLFTYRFTETDTRNDYRASGVLYFRDRLTRSPSVQLYVKRMLVNYEDRSSIPPYAIFMTGLVECPNPAVDLARRQISMFDPAYKWLRRVMYRQFEAAFLRFASTQVERLVQLWGNVDSSFISHLLEAFHSDDLDLKQAADSFLVHAGPLLPFYIVDLISGSQGVPLVRSIREIVDRRKSEVRGNEKVAVYYTKSRSPLEKDMLLNIHKDGLIDVGRPEKNHESLIVALHSLNHMFTDFTLEEVKASQFESIPETALDQWRTVINLLKASFIIFNRSNDVVAEKFYPSTTPVVITDTNVDPREIETFRDTVTRMGAVGGDVSKRLLQVLEGMTASGGTLTVHLNSSNTIMIQLRDTINSRDSEVKDAAAAGLMSIVFRAALDYFGWHSTRDMIAKDRTLTHQIISNLLAVTNENSILRDDLGRKTRELDGIKPRLAELEGVNRPSSERRFEAIVGFIDMVDSTRLLIANPAAGPQQVSQFIRVLIHEIEALIRIFGAMPVSFTGDGILFYLEQPVQPIENVRTRLHNLSCALEIVSSNKPEFRSLMESQQAELPKLRIALAYGDVFLGPVGPTNNLIGLSVVEAARLCSERQFYDQGKCELLVTGHAFDVGARWSIWRAREFERLGEFTPKGLNRELVVYGPRQ
jgi:HSP90 family molecular chaperone/class 3 adenylate cyclase